MARNINSNYYEDTYCKNECQSCKKAFIVGEILSERMTLICPYCGSKNLTMTAASTADTAEDMDMGCLGIYFSRYDDVSLMLYTEHEFAAAMKNSLEVSGEKGIPLGMVYDIITDYCIQRDGMQTN